MTNDASKQPALSAYNKTAVIAISTTTSGAIDTRGTLTGFILPALFTGTALTFTVSDSSTGTFVALYDDAGSQVELTVAQDTAVYIDPIIFAGWQYIKFVSGSTETAERTIKLAIRPV